MGLNETYSNSNETWSAGSSRPKITMEHHLLAIQSPLMGLWCPTEAIMHFLKFLGLIPLCVRGRFWPNFEAIKWCSGPLLSRLPTARDREVLGSSEPGG